MLVNDKLLFKASEIKVINVPSYDELSCKNVSKLVRSDPVVQKYFKDEWIAEKQTHTCPSGGLVTSDGGNCIVLLF